MNNREEMSEGMTPKLPLWSYQVQSDSKLGVRTRKDLEIHLITRALKDEAFKQELLANPKAVVEKELGTKLSEELEINVLEETEDTLYMVLPCNPYEGMSEEELKVSLGMTYEDVAQWVFEQQRNTLLEEESIVRVMVRAWSDEVFKQELLYNPIKVVEIELGENIPEDIKLKVFAETAQKIYLILPAISEDFDLLNLKTNLLSELNVLMIAGNSCGLAGCQQLILPLILVDPA
jgi:hypothetical protein